MPHFLLLLAVSFLNEGKFELKDVEAARFPVGPERPASFTRWLGSPVKYKQCCQM